MRLFGRIFSFDCECPSCGQILKARSSLRPQVWERSDAMPAHWARPRDYRTERAELPWNPITGRFRCTNCRRVFATGLLIYEVIGTDKGLPPADHVPDEAQREALWAGERSRARKRPRQFGVRSGDPTNRREEPDEPEDD